MDSIEAGYPELRERGTIGKDGVVVLMVFIEPRACSISFRFRLTDGIALVSRRPTLDRVARQRPNSQSASARSRAARPSQARRMEE